MAKCTWKSSSIDSGLSATYECPDTAIWKGLCIRHGGKYPPEEDLMLLLGAITGWSEQSLLVSTQCIRVTDHSSRSTASKIEFVWILTTSTSGTNLKVIGRGSSLVEALWALILEAQRIIRQTAGVLREQEIQIDKLITKFVEIY